MAVAFATIERPQVVQRLVLSIRRYFPDMPIYVADQSRQVEPMMSFYAANAVTLVRMPYDIGVTASRNRLAREIKEDYMILCDDDFVFGPQTDFRDAVKILEADQELAVVGGRLFDLVDKVEYVRNWEIYLQYDPKQKLLFSIPIYELAPKVREVSGVRYYLCDAVMNFAVFRRSAFSAGLQWDERFKSNGEHEDFYLNLKLNTAFKVAHLPTMVAHHDHPEVYRVYRAHLRERNEGWRLFLEKWGLEQHIEYGLGVRTIDDIDRITAEADARARFFVNPELSLSRPAATKGGLLIGDHTKIVTVGALDQTGQALAGKRTLGSLLINTQSADIVVVPQRDDQAGGPDPRLSPIDLLKTYNLEGSNQGEAVSTADEPLYFRYDPVARKNAEFFLWYLCAAPPRRKGATPRRLAVVARWSAPDGTALVWRSRQMFIELQSTPYWRPLFLEAPVFPQGCRWLRFDLVADGGADAYPVCTGFLFRTASDTADFSDVLALSRLPNDGTRPGEPGRELEEIARGCRTLPITPSAVAGDIAILDIDALAGLEALYFVGWNMLGRALVSARLPPGNLPLPRALALPAAGWSASGTHVFGYGETTGFVVVAEPEEALVVGS